MWDRFQSSPVRGVRPIAAPRREIRVWTIEEIRKFLLASDERWRPLFVVALFTGLRVGELQAMAWDDQNRPNFTTNKLEVSCAWSHRAKGMGPPKSPRGVRAIDVVPSVRRALQSHRQTAQGPLVFTGRRGGVLSQPDISEAFHETLKAAGVARIRFHDCRHVFASLLIAAGKNVKYIATQMGHHSAAFTLDTYGHLMDRLPVRPVEWIDDIVFPEGFEAALKMHLSAARSGEIASHAVQSSEERKPKIDAAPSDLAQPGVAGFVVGRAGLELATPSGDREDPEEDDLIGNA